MPALPRSDQRIPGRSPPPSDRPRRSPCDGCQRRSTLATACPFSPARSPGPPSDPPRGGRPRARAIDRRLTPRSTARGQSRARRNRARRGSGPPNWLSVRRGRRPSRSATTPGESRRRCMPRSRTSESERLPRPQRGWRIPPRASASREFSCRCSFSRTPSARGHRDPSRPRHRTRRPCQRLPLVSFVLLW